MTTAAMHVARTGLDAQSTRMRVIANNLANVNTTGFKRDRASFETMAYQNIRAPGANSPSMIRVRSRSAAASGRLERAMGKVVPSMGLDSVSQVVYKIQVRITEG